jgi:hypothetical protein
LEVRTIRRSDEGGEGARDRWISIKGQQPSSMAEGHISSWGPSPSSSTVTKQRRGVIGESEPALPNIWDDEMPQPQMPGDL